MLPSTIGSQFEAQGALAEIRAVSKVVGDQRRYGRLLRRRRLLLLLPGSIATSERSGSFSASRIFDLISDDQLESAVRGSDESRRRMQRLKDEPTRKNQVILSARLAPRLGNSIKMLCAKISDILSFLQMGVRTRAGPPPHQKQSEQNDAGRRACAEALGYFTNETGLCQKIVRGNPRRTPWDGCAARKNRRCPRSRNGILVR